MIDQSKAFDLIDHRYLFKILDHMNLGDRIVKSIRRIYRNASTNLAINDIFSHEIIIQRGIKQGCPLSMWLYTVAIEDLLIKIDKNDSIIGYKMNILDNQMVKSRAYADDVSIFTSDSDSITEVFNEFEKWGEYSGAEINLNKTKIIRNNCNINQDIFKYVVNEAKLLGIVINKNGISRTNLSNTLEKIKKAIFLWSGCKLDILQRVTALKTFILSKLWYILNFIHLDKDLLKLIERLSFNFIWGSKREFIKREQLTKEKKEGGINMINIKAKCDAIKVRFFLEFLSNHKRIEYQFGIKCFKFEIREHLDNFNNIPLELNVPSFYKNILKAYKNFENINKGKDIYNQDGEPLPLKEIYSIINKQFNKFSAIEMTSKIQNWKKIFEDINLKDLPSKFRSLNYKILYNGLSTMDKFKHENAIKCFLCNKKKENIKHLFGECETVNNAVKAYNSELLDNNNENNFEIFTKNIKLKKNQIIIMSKIKYIVWQVRNIIKNDGNIVNIKNFLISKFENFSDNDHG